jgi:hypothetical protein
MAEGGNAEKIVASIEIKNNEIKAEQIVFQTPQGMLYEKKHLHGNVYEITTLSGINNDIQQICALYPVGDGKFYNFGRVDVISYSPQTVQLVVVQVTDKSTGEQYTINENSLREYLNSVYAPIGVTWDITFENYDCDDDLTNFFDEGSNFLSAYNDKMKMLNAAYKQAKGGDFNKKACYLFLLGESGDGTNHRNTLGYMQRGRQFGYIFTKNISDSGETAAHVIAHELGHGRWSLRHTFDSDYGTDMKAVETLDNLMSYSHTATHLAKWQWSQINNPAIIVNPFADDEDGMSIFEAKEFSVFYNDFEFNKEDTVRILKNYHTKIKLETKEKIKEEWRAVKVDWTMNNQETKNQDTLSFNINDLVTSNFTVKMQKGNVMQKKYIATLFVELLNIDIEEEIIKTLQELTDLQATFDNTVNAVNKEIEKLKYDAFLIKGSNDIYVKKGLHNFIEALDYQSTENVLFDLLQQLYQIDLLISKYEGNFDKIIEQINKIMTKNDEGKYVIDTAFMNSLIAEINDIQDKTTEDTEQLYKTMIKELTIKNISKNE